MKKKEPIAYILNNLAVIFQVYIASKKSPKETYEALKAILPEIEKEIEFPSFNSRIKPIMDTYEFLESCKGQETEKQADLTQEVKRLNTIINKLYDDLQVVNVNEVNMVNVETDKPTNEVNLNQVNMVNLNEKEKMTTGEMLLYHATDLLEHEKKLQSDKESLLSEPTEIGRTARRYVIEIEEYMKELAKDQLSDLDKMKYQVEILRLKEKTQTLIEQRQFQEDQSKTIDISEGDYEIKTPEQSEVNSVVNPKIDKPVNMVNLNEVNAMINEFLQRLERLEKAVFQVNLNEVNVVNPDKVNPFKDKPTNEVNSDKIKVGKWNITSRQGKRGDVSYKAFRNFGDKGKYRDASGEVLKGVKGIHIGKEFNEAAIREKIEKAGYPID